MMNRGEQGYETELKLELTRDVYEEILSKCPEFRPSVNQRNSFFDTEDRAFRKNRWALRIREEEPEYYLTVKGPTDRDKTGVFSRPEFECRIRAEDAHLYYRGFRISGCPEKPCMVLLGKFGDVFVERIFSFRNIRRFVSYGKWELEIDRTTIGDEILYELEIEVRREQAKSLEKAVRLWFLEENWRYRPSRATKFERAERIYDEGRQLP